MRGHGDDGGGGDGARRGGLERFLVAAAGLGVEVEPQAYPQGTRTAADAAAAIGCQLDQIVKSLVFVADDATPVLALTSGGNRVDTAALADAVGAASVRKADADEARDATGYTIGGTPPFGHVHELRTVLDPHLLSFETVYAAAGTATDNFGISPTRLVELTGAEVVDVTER